MPHRHLQKNLAKDPLLAYKFCQARRLHPSDPSNHLASDPRILSPEASRLADAAAASSWEEKVAKTQNIGELWGFLAYAEGRTSGAKQRPPAFSYQPIEFGGSIADSHKSFAEVYAFYLCSRFGNSPDPLSAEANLMLDECPADPCPPVSVSGGRAAINHRNSKAAPGRDGVPIFVWANLPATLAPLSQTFS